MIKSVNMVTWRHVVTLLTRQETKLTAHVVWTAGVLSVVRHQLLSIFTLRRQQVTQTLVTHCTVTDYIITQLKCSFQFTVLMVNHSQSHSGLWSHRRLSVGSSWCHQPGWWSPLPLDGTLVQPRWSSHTRRGRWCHCHSGTCSRHPSRLPTPRHAHEEPQSCRCRLEEFIKKIQHVIRNVWFFFSGYKSNVSYHTSQVRCRGQSMVGGEASPQGRCSPPSSLNTGWGPSRSHD